MTGAAPSPPTHHVSPIHPAYADIGPAEYDPARALAEMQALGLAEFEHELVTVDDEWQRNTGDAVAALLRDAGAEMPPGAILPGQLFWDNWRTYPFSATQWNHRTAGRAGAGAGLSVQTRPGTRPGSPMPNSTCCWIRRCRSRMPTPAAPSWPRSRRYCATRA